MELIIINVFSTIIVFATVYFIIKALMIARKREEITLKQFIGWATLSIGIGLFIASILPFGFQRLFDAII